MRYALRSLKVPSPPRWHNMSSVRLMRPFASPSCGLVPIRSSGVGAHALWEGDAPVRQVHRRLLLPPPSPWLAMRIAPLQVLRRQPQLCCKLGRFWRGDERGLGFLFFIVLGLGPGLGLELEGVVAFSIVLGFVPGLGLERGVRGHGGLFRRILSPLPCVAQRESVSMPPSS